MASYVQGYDEDRFVTEINRNFFCLICFNVLRDPVVCPRNQHCFCRSCITKHLGNTQRCPTCADHLTVETLVDATRIVKDYLNESKIRCVYIDRGCQEIVRLEQLEEHEATCGFTPVVCTNQGCGVIVSRGDLVHHESEVCEFRKLMCHLCEETTKTLSDIEKRMTKMEANMKENMEKVEVKMGESKAELKQEFQAEMDNLKTNMKRNTAELQAHMANLKMDLEDRFEAEVRGLKAALLECFDEIKDVLVKFGLDKHTQILRGGAGRCAPPLTSNCTSAEISGTSPENKCTFLEIENNLLPITKTKPKSKVTKINAPPPKTLTPPLVFTSKSGLADKTKKIITEGRPRPSGDRENILVDGGRGNTSVEMFNWRQKIWLPLQSLPEERCGATSFVYNDHVTIAGGYGADFKKIDTMIQMNVESIPDFSTHWSEYLVKLPAKLADHSSVVYNDQLIVTGGSIECVRTSDCIYEIQLNHPYTSTVLSRMPEPRQRHCSEMFDDKLLTVGGRTSPFFEDSLNSVLLYDVKKNEYKHLAPLPYEVSSFASVKYGDNIVVIGGCDKRGNDLNTIVMYNVMTQQSHMLPPMKCKRSRSAAVVVGKNIVVLGGYAERSGLKSVEVFSFDRNAWSGLPEMSEGRRSHTAVVV